VQNIAQQQRPIKVDDQRQAGGRGIGGVHLSP
jgi:hypothetical protein